MKTYRHILLLALILPVIAAGLGSFLAEREAISHSLVRISLAAGFLCGISALFSHYLKSRSQLPIVFVAIFLVTLFFRLSIIVPISLISLLLVNLVYGAFNHLLIRYIFFHRDLVRVRTIITGIGGGLLFGAYLPYLYKMMGITTDATFGTYFMFGLIVYVFIAFSMSMADLIIIRNEVQLLQDQADDDEEDDA